MGQVRHAPDSDPEPGGADGALEVLDQSSAARQARGLTSGSSPTAQPGRLHRFSQFDFPFRLGPADGRYIARSEPETADVIVFRTLGGDLQRSTRARRSLGRRRPARAEPGETEPDPVVVTRVTVIPGSPFEDSGTAAAWLARCRDIESAEGEVREALRLVNRAVQAHRVAAGDPYVADVSLEQARRVRLGYGTGEELVGGDWREAYALPAERVRRGRRRMLAPQEQLAGILGGRSSVHPSEDLLLRARMDLDQGRTRPAALQARAAYAALQSELRSSGGAEQARSTLRAQGDPVEALAAVALEGPLDSEQAASLEELITAMERLVRRRRHAGEPGRQP